MDEDFAFFDKTSIMNRQNTKHKKPEILSFFFLFLSLSVFVVKNFFWLDPFQLGLQILLERKVGTEPSNQHTD